MALGANGRATYATSALTGGSHTVIATYLGSSVFAGSGSATLTQVVNRATSTTVVTSSRNPSVFGQSVTFTARVTPVAATGSVQFFLDGAAVGGPVALDATGRARLVTSTLVPGAHTVSVSYGGNVNYLTSSSAPRAQTVTKASSRSVVTSSGTPAPQGSTVVLTATVTAVAPGVGTPTGTVQFRIDGALAGTPLVLNSSGQAAYPISTLTVGRHTVSVVYSGDVGFNAGTSGSFTQRIQ
jgi:hypothetical protein